MQNNVKSVRSFRFSRETVQQLERIAKSKRATKTKVLEQLIYIAYISLFEKFGTELDKFLKVIVNDFEKREKMKKATHK